MTPTPSTPAVPPADAEEMARPAGAQAITTAGRQGLGSLAFQLLAQIPLLLWAIMVIFPFLWMIMTALKTDREILTDPFGLPENLIWENFERAWTTANIGTYFVNTLIVMAMSLTGTLLVSAMAAYVIARFEFPLNRILYMLFTAGLMFPVFLGLVPLYFLMDDVHLLNTYHGLALVYIAYSLPFTIFFLTAFFKTLPTSVAEAAIIDGASHYGLFFRVMLPMAKPGLVSVGIFNFLGQWNQYMLPTVLNTDPDKRVLTQGLVQLAVSQGYKGDWSGLFAGLVRAMLPVLAAYIIFQRQVVAGLTAGALK
jgi:N-acetylglucosamine transport system permease protein